MNESRTGRTIRYAETSTNSTWLLGGGIDRSVALSASVKKRHPTHLIRLRKEILTEMPALVILMVLLR